MLVTGEGADMTHINAESHINYVVMMSTQTACKMKYKQCKASEDNA
jgi:hypothetical protein